MRYRHRVYFIASGYGCADILDLTIGPVPHGAGLGANLRSVLVHFRNGVLNAVQRPVTLSVLTPVRACDNRMVVIKPYKDLLIIGNKLVGRLDLLRSVRVVF